MAFSFFLLYRRRQRPGVAAHTAVHATDVAVSTIRSPLEMHKDLPDGVDKH